MSESTPHRPSRRLATFQKLALLAASRARGPHDVDRTRTITRSMEMRQRRARGVEEHTATVADVPVRWFRPVGAGPALIFHVHGGAFVAGSSVAARSHSRLALSNKADLVSVDYRLAPEHPFPAALDDLWAVYLQVARGRPTVIIGESAGGGLALSLTRRLLDEGAEPPRSVVTLFPWADLTNISDSFLSNEHRDLLSRAGLNHSAGAYAGDHELTAPLVSPLYGSFAGFPPTLIIVGTHDCLLDDSRNTAARMRAAGVDTTLVEVSGGFHGFILLPVPEADAARQRISSFVKTALADH
ncbi:MULTISPECIES: alpha/beta hydrolase [Mycobacteriaceae]|uniref:alpha/beta hydrolase n=1 Tax=Mycobacteriaceae TaxID=1762 RepID=UPI00036BE3CB|nr:MULTISPECIES: alpha/beta hydrolase [Mycobacteriaceae]AXK75464.1 alpha/beta hydrolase [Mycolicibacterium neoaurum]